MTDFSKYRKNAGIVLINDEGFVWVGERSDVKNAWQLPQGGIDKGEAPVDAAWRELLEETGVPRNDAELLAEHPEWITYEWPKKNARPDDTKIGQAQKWFLFRFTGGEIHLENATDQEFVNWQWATADWIYDQTVAFRKPVYKEVFKGFSTQLT